VKLRAHVDAELSQSNLDELAARMTGKRGELTERVEPLEQQMVVKDDCSQADAADAASAQENRLRKTYARSLGASWYRRKGITMNVQPSMNPVEEGAPPSAQTKRMVGLEDGIADALFRFSHATTGGYYWCPPATDGRLDLGAL